MLEPFRPTVPVDYLNDFGEPGGVEYALLAVCKAKHVVGCELYRSRPALIEQMLEAGLGTPTAWRWRLIDHKEGKDASLGLTFYVADKADFDTTKKFNKLPHQGKKECERRNKQNPVHAIALTSRD
jgi:hypothetical protein